MKTNNVDCAKLEVKVKPSESARKRAGNSNLIFIPPNARHQWRRARVAGTASNCMPLLDCASFVCPGVLCIEAIEVPVVALVKKSVE